ncbi:MAG: DUF3299 domain-containing protein [Litorilituus sp.]|jgi:hypothetical protein|nr:DUF3299 domain-containing protein [Litorilituus sp.]
MKLLALWCCLFILLGCEKTKSQDGIPSISAGETSMTSERMGSMLPNNQPTITSNKFMTIAWENLIPKEDLEAILNPPDYIVQVVDGSVEDQITNAVQSSMNNDQVAGEVYEQALNSTTIIKAMDGKYIRIPGFVVPVEFTNEKQISSFFLVPYFGACLHMPPPPPNQIIYIESEQAISLESLYDPVWVSGKLSAELFEDQIATSAYTMQLEKLVLYYPK